MYKVNMNNKSLFSVKLLAAAAIAVISASAFAEDAAPEVSPVTANVTVTSDYVFRGLSQTNFKPAIQGGFDFADEGTGLYVGNWNSSITWISDAYGQNGYVYTPKGTGKAVSAPVEMDFYAGIRKDLIGDGFVSDLGVVTYYYPTSGIPNTGGLYANPNTTEVYVAQNYTFGPVTGNIKFSYAVTTLFGTANSTGSYYPEFNTNYDTGVWGLGLNAHVGMQTYQGNTPSGATYYSNNTIPTATSNSSLYSYTDWKLGISKDFGGGLIGNVAYTGTNAKNLGVNGYAYSSPQGNNLGKSQGFVSLTKTF